MEQLAEHARCGRSSTVLDAVSLSLTEGAAATHIGHSLRFPGPVIVGLTPTGVQRSETRSLAARLIPRPDRGR
jgi:hypothetical protein